MNYFDKDEIPMLSETCAQRSDDPQYSAFRRNISRTRSASISIPMREQDIKNLQGNMNYFDKDEIPMQSETCAQRSDDPQYSAFRRNISRTQSASISIPMASLAPHEDEFRNLPNGNNKGFGRKHLSFCSSCIPRVMKPHTKVVQQWNKILAISCSIAIVIDPLFFFLYYVKKDDKCIVINWTLAMPLVLLRSITDVLYSLSILLQFRLAYINPESRVFDDGDLIIHPTRIALNYLKTYFLIDLFVVLPLPQIMILLALPNSLGFAEVHYAKNLLCIVIYGQYISRLFRFLHRISGKSPIRIMFVSAWANLIMSVLIIHAVGASWYIFALERVNKCLRHACHHSNLLGCMDLIDCDPKVGNISAKLWSEDKGADACFNATYDDVFSYGIYANAIPLTIETKLIHKYVYAFFWGFQQVITLAGNQTPSYFVWEVLFTISIMALGLLLLVLFIGNIQGYFQSLGKSSLEMMRRGRDVEQWMSHCRLPEDLKKRVRQAEQYSWVAIRGVPEKMVPESLPEDLQTDIRRHLFKFVKKVRIFSHLNEDEPVLDAIRERLIHTRYMKGSRILSQGGLVQKMVFIVCGKLESIGEDGTPIRLSEEDTCGEELLSWYLDQSSEGKGKKVKLKGHGLTSDRTVRCLTYVEACSLHAEDIEELTNRFARFWQSPYVQGVIRYKSPYWRSLAVKRIQAAWRHRKNRLSQANTTQKDSHTLRYEWPYGKSLSGN